MNGMTPANSPFSFPSSNDLGPGSQISRLVHPLKAPQKKNTRSMKRAADEAASRG